MTEEVARSTQINLWGTVVKGNKEVRRCVKAESGCFKTMFVGVLRWSWRHAPQQDFWAAFARKARQTRIRQRALISLVTLRSIWPNVKAYSLVTWRSGSYSSFWTFDDEWESGKERNADMGRAVRVKYRCYVARCAGRSKLL